MTTLRPAGDGDLAGIRDVFWECWTRSYAAFASADALSRLSPEDAEALWSGALDRGETVVALDAADRVVGVVRFTADVDRLALHSLYVHPREQGGGIGGALLDAAESAAGDVPGADLWVFSDNAPAREFYGRRGWRPDGATRVEDQFGMPEARLTRTARGRAPEVLVSRGVCAADTENPPLGAVVGVWTPDGEDVWAAGARDTAGTPMEPGTIHDLASVTKLVTTCALLALVSGRRLDLDAPVSRHLPWSGEDPTIRQLLQHRAGLLPWQPLHHVARRRADVLGLLPELPRGAGVGEAYAYSDLGFIVLGAVVEAVTGMPLDVAVSALVTAPLGLRLHFRPRFDSAGEGGDGDVAESALDEGWEERMIATGAPYPVLVAPDPGLPPVQRRPGPIRETVHDGNAFHAMGGVSGHAGIFGSVPDLVRLGRALVDCSHGLWSEEVVEAFTTPGPDPLQGLGFRLRPLGHAGADADAHADDNDNADADADADDSARGEGRIAWHPGFTGTALGVRLGAEPAVVAMATNRHLHDGAPVPTDRLWERVLQAEELVP